MPLSEDDIQALLRAEHGEPFGVLGPHETPEGLSVRALLPGARSVGVIHAGSGDALAMLQRHGDADFFSALVPAAPARLGYFLQVRWDEHTQLIDDPYRFGPMLGEADLRRLAEGTPLRPWEQLGAHPMQLEGVHGTAFAVWAPNARRVSVVGDFNQWDGRRHPMRRHPTAGVWELFLPHVGVGAAYAFELLAAHGEVLRKADPYARSTRLRPATACVVQALPAPVPPSAARAAANARGAPISLYEVHLGSWQRKNGFGWLSYRELADTLVPYARDMGFTHLALMPVSEHPVDGSWGYRPVGLYAPTSRFGTPADFRHLVEAAHAAGLGVVLDWVPTHFPSEAHGLARFDGSALYEGDDPEDGNTRVFDWQRPEVQHYLAGNALYWLERYGVDGLRVDALTAMLYRGHRGHRRTPAPELPQTHGGHENLEAIAFLRRLNAWIRAQRPGALMLAGDPGGFPAVTRATHEGGLGFDYVWHTGWTRDTLSYAALEPAHRPHHPRALRVSLMHAHSEQFVLPLPHDEVAHGQGALLARMPGDAAQQFAGLRNLYGYQWACPGKKLLFMGNEFGQRAAWNHDRSLDWRLLEDAPHKGLQTLVRDLNRAYRDHPALHELDGEPAGFAWLAHDAADPALLAFIRRARDGSCVVAVCNFSPTARHAHRLGLPAPGPWREALNTDHPDYGGAGVANAAFHTDATPWHGQPQSAEITVPPLATVYFVRA